MSTELLPLGYKCNIACKYCYQDPCRDGGNEGTRTYSMEAMFAGLSDELLKADGTKKYESARFLVFGGEPLLVPLSDLREIWRWGLGKFGGNGVQTNGTLITDAHVAAFREFAVHVGMSLDGPGELNDIRWGGTLEATRTQTARSDAALRRLLAEHLRPSLIVTLHQGNASADRLPRLLAWMRELAGLGLVYLNVHLLETDSADVRTDWALSDEENAAALLALADLMTLHPTLQVEPIISMVRLLLGDDERDGGVPCIWNACDPYTTDAVHGVLGDGTRANCGRTNKEGVNWVKADTRSFIRQLVLYETPQEHGGCQGCRFFFACKGNCPGTAVDGDWRNRTAHCGALMRTFEQLERNLVRLGLRPISRDETQRPVVEERLLAAYRANRNLSVAGALRDGAAPPPGAPGDIPHGDVAHGDHDDAVQPVVTHGDSGRVHASA